MAGPRVPFGDVWIAVARVGEVWVVFVYLGMDDASSGAGVRPALQAELRCRQAPAMRLSVLGLIGSKLERKTRLLSVWPARDPRNS
jgi:hypothetical protein